jgi:hypothetical protein
VLELAPRPPGATGCFGRAAALDALAADAALAVRVAPTELLLLGERGVAAIEALLLALDPGGLVVDVTSAYATWSFRGTDRHEAFARLSALPLPQPPAAVQGLVAHVPAKVVVRPDELLVTVPSTVSHHLRARVLAACADLELHELPAPPAREPGTRVAAR